THPAGSSLNDLIKICAMSYNDFVQGKYDASFRPSECPAEFKPFFSGHEQGETPVFKLLSELTKMDLQLLTPEIYLYFTQPLRSGTYEFTITMRADDGDLTTKCVVGV
ncbi:MAG: hypothetical protein RSB29_06770, partial [Alistipes sp.]